jgi:hypothetical protein
MSDKIGAFYLAGRKCYCVGCRLGIAKGEPYVEPWWSYGRLHFDCFEKAAASHKEQFEKSIADIRSQIIQAKKELVR